MPIIQWTNNFCGSIFKTTNLFFVGSGKGLQRTLWIATRAVFSTSASRHNSKLCMVGYTFNPRLVELLIECLQFLTVKTFIGHQHWNTIASTNAPFGVSSFNIKTCQLAVPFVSFHRVNWFFTRRIGWLKLIWLKWPFMLEIAVEIRDRMTAFSSYCLFSSYLRNQCSPYHTSQPTADMHYGPAMKRPEKWEKCSFKPNFLGKTKKWTGIII